MTAVQDNLAPAQDLRQKEAELAAREAQLADKEAELAVKEETVKKGFKSKLYDRINVSLRTMDIFIGCVVALILVAVAVGIFTAG